METGRLTLGESVDTRLRCHRVTNRQYCSSRRLPSTKWLTDDNLWNSHGEDKRTSIRRVRLGERPSREESFWKGQRATV